MWLEIDLKLIHRSLSSLAAHPLWRSWLSYKRTEPPTEQEIQKNLEDVKRLKERANQVFERDLDKFPKFAEKLKASGDAKEKPEKGAYLRYKEYY